jgi:DUF4097 and DUF4098 domain-containing protein YvlB
VWTLLAASATDLSAVASAEADRQSRTFALPSTRTLTLDMTVGDLTIVGSDRTDARIDINRRAPSETGLARIPVTFEETADALRVRAVQSNGDTNPALRSDITLDVPRDARLGPVNVVEGRVTLRGLRGSIALAVRRGPIHATDVSGSVRLETEIGHLTVDKTKLSDAGVLRLRTFNGDITLTLAERPANARILALALNGTIQSDIPLNTKDKWGPRSGEATLGRGEPVISLDVVTGRIEIRSP